MALRRTRRVQAALGAALALASALPATAQTLFPAGPGPYDPTVPTVSGLRGFDTGTGMSTYRDVERVLEGIAAASPRVRLETYGASVEGRPLRLVWISSPANLARLESILAAQRDVASGRRSGLPPDQPILVWLSFGVHGDEASPSEAALELVYQLAASRDATVERWLERAVVIVDPLLNPDGHERYVTWYRAVAGPVPDPDPAAREHRPPWPSGRTNHYYYDLNRDWAWGVQPETRARRAVYLRALPEVHVDFHEMGADKTYFFFPPAPPVNAFLPASTGEWGSVFGAANAAAFDARGWPYFTGEDYDLFYPGYGDSWPSFYGATGMTYEQAGGGTAGITLRRDRGPILTLADRVEHHLVAALTTVDTAVENRAGRLADFEAFWGPGNRRPAGASAAYVVARTGDDAERLAGLLSAQGIEVDTLAAPLAGGGLTPFFGAPAVDDSLPAGTFSVPGDQPLGRYVAALMAPQTALPDSSLFYDITGWSLPYLFGVAAWRADGIPGATGRWTPRPPPQAPPPPPGTLLLAWDYRTTADVVAAARLVAGGIRVRVADRPFRVRDRRFRTGAFLVPVDGQPDSLASGAALQRAIEAAGARPVPLTSFRTTDGIDLGSSRVRPVRDPRVALAAGSAVEPTSLGASWTLLLEAGVDVELVRLEDLAAAPGDDETALAGRESAPLALDGFDAVILPDGPGPEAYAAALGETGAARLGRWVDAGGVLVGIGAGAGWLTSGVSGLTSFEMLPPAEPGDDQRRTPVAQRETDEMRARIPGTLVAARADTTSPLGYGFATGQVAVLIRDPVEFRLAPRGDAWLYMDREPLAGYLPAGARERLPGTPWALVAERGAGHVVLFGDDPAFRGITRATSRALLNALLLLPAP